MKKLKIKPNYNNRLITLYLLRTWQNEKIDNHTRSLAYLILKGYL